MLVRPNSRWAMLMAAAVLGLSLTGCATKKFVRKMTDPLTQRLGKNEAKTAENSQDIKDLDQKTEEGISAAQSKADEASTQAANAGKQAQTAQILGQRGIDQANAVDQKLENADNFRTVQSATVLFKINKSSLTDEAAQQLDQLADSVKSLKHYVIEVQGFTDSSGPAQYNLALSHKRADSVVRYLTAKHNIPLVKIQLLGYGEDSPAAPNTTREGRQENRRVEIKVLAPDWSSSQVQANATSSKP